jgi:hypothetical protein
MTEDIQINEINDNLNDASASSSDPEEENVRVTRSMAREKTSSVPQIESALGDKSEFASQTDWGADKIDITCFDRITSFTAFMMGLMINWGSFNIMGFMMGMNYRFFIKRKNTSRLYLELQTVIPAFVLGVFLVNIYLPYFIASVVAGYTYRSRGASLQENVNSVFSKIPERYRDGMRFGNRNEFLRSILGVVSETITKEKTV